MAADEEEEEELVGLRHVSFRTLDGRTFQMDVAPGMTVREVRAALRRSALREVPLRRRIRFIHMGRLLPDDADMVREVGVHPVVHCVVAEVDHDASSDDNGLLADTPAHIDYEAEDRRVAEEMQRAMMDEAGVAQGIFGLNAGIEARRRARQVSARFRSSAVAADDANPVGSFVLAFVFGFVFGFFTLLFVQRLSRRQIAGLILGISLNFAITALAQGPPSNPHSARARRRRFRGPVVHEHLDRLGNVYHGFSDDSKPV